MKKKEKIEEVEKNHEECLCGRKCGCKKNNGLKFVLLLIVLIGVFIGGLIIGGAVLVDDKNNDIAKKENIFEYQATSNTMNILGVVKNNDNKEGTYVIDYDITRKDEKKKKVSIEFEWENGSTATGVSVSGVKDNKINLVFEEKTVEFDGYEDTVVVINDYFGYVFVINYSSFLPLGNISVYDLSGSLVRTFDNVVNSYYVCGVSYEQDNYVNLNVDYSESFYGGSTIYLVEGFEINGLNPNWFSSPVSILKLDFETLETEKVSEFNACFSQQ